MDKFLLHLRVLDGILDKKINVLKQILNITENQQTVLSTRVRDSSALTLYKGMSEEKQKLIDIVNNSDRVFERAYREISPVFEKEAYNYSGLVKHIQYNIKQATTLDVRIRVQEARNSAPRHAPPSTRDNKSTRKRVAQIYEKNKTAARPRDN